MLTLLRDGKFVRSCVALGWAAREPKSSPNGIEMETQRVLGKPKCVNDQSINQSIKICARKRTSRAQAQLEQGARSLACNSSGDAGREFIAKRFN